MAIAAQTPNCGCVMPTRWPIIGKMKSAIELRMKTVPRATDISSSVALTTGPTAAIALPPQIAVPDEMRCDVVRLMFMARPSRKPRSNVPTIVTMVNTNPVRPASG
jgi:hypothetical protein